MEAVSKQNSPIKSDGAMMGKSKYNPPEDVHALVDNLLVGDIKMLEISPGTMIYREGARHGLREKSRKSRERD